MLKVAFIGDSYASYEQSGQGNNSWTYLLAKHFPQHQYYNYAQGGRGYDFYQVCLLDAKIRNIDVILINRTFPHRVSELHGNEPYSFSVSTIDDNYFTLHCADVIWYSLHVDAVQVHSKREKKGVIPNNKIVPASLFNSYNEVLRYKAVSEQNIDYRKKWYENMHLLYNFKHIVKLELLRNPTHDAIKDSAYELLREAFKLNEVMYEYSKNGGKVSSENDFNEFFLDPGEIMQLLFNIGLTISPNDDHWSPKANKWVFDNYILPRVVDILS